MPEQVTLLSLQTFSTTGGIQKMTRTLGYSFQQLANSNLLRFRFWSLYDSPQTLRESYVAKENFKGFSNNRIKFMLAIMAIARQTDHLIITHINLSLAGLLIKLINPNCKIYLIAHGIEVWRPLSICQRTLLKKCHLILCVSTYTQQKVVEMHKVNSYSTQVLNNALDPLMPLPTSFCSPKYLSERYHIADNDQVIFTLTRLASTEQYKGYEQVIKTIKHLKKSYPHIKYILAGQYDTSELVRIQTLIQQLGVQDQVIITGFIPDHELTDHFLLADLFVLPSKKEGFGLVFIEALACGLPVICGNTDGSIDAIKHGELGTSINVDNMQELEDAITKHLARHINFTDRQLLQNKCAAYFSELQYREKVWGILNDGFAGELHNQIEI